MRLMRFMCTGCGLEMALPDKPERCFCCGSTDIARVGWKQRFRSICMIKGKEECDKR